MNERPQESHLGTDGQEVRWDRFASLWHADQASDVSPVRARATVLAFGLWTVAAIGLFVGWNGAAGRPSTELQLPYILTAGLFALFTGAAGMFTYAGGVILGEPRSRHDEPDRPSSDGDAGEPPSVGVRDEGSKRAGTGSRGRKLVAGATAAVIVVGMAAPLASADVETPDEGLAALVAALDQYADELDADADGLDLLHAAGPLSRTLLNLHVVRSQVDIAPVLTAVLDAGTTVVEDLAAGRLSPTLVGEAIREPLVDIAGSTTRSGRVATTLLERSAWAPGEARIQQEDQLDPNDLLVPVYQLSVEVLQPILDVIEASEPVLAPLEDVFDAACVDGLGLVQLGVNAAPALLELPELPVDLAQLVNGALTPTFLVCSALPTPEKSPGDDQSGSTPEPVAVPVPPADSTPPEVPPPSAPPTESFVAPPAASEPPLSQGAADVVEAPTAAEPGPVVSVIPIDAVGIVVDRSIEHAGILAILVLGAAVASTVRRWRPDDGWEVPTGGAALVAAFGVAALAWHGVASSATGWVQLPYVLSGAGASILLGMAGAALVATPMLESFRAEPAHGSTTVAPGA